jgi:hypothetical protein
MTIVTTAERSRCTDKHHNDQLLIEEFHVPFGGTLDPDNRWVNFSALMPWVEQEETYASQSPSPTTSSSCTGLPERRLRRGEQEAQAARVPPNQLSQISTLGTIPGLEKGVAGAR